MGKNVIETIPIQKKHMHGVIELLQSISDFKPNLDEYDSVWNTFIDQPNVHSMVALIDDKIVGYGTVIIGTNIRGGKMGHVEDIVSHNDFRNEGIGKAILVSLYEIAVDNECYKIALACKEQYIPFYEKCFYELHGFSMQRFI